MKRSPLFRWIPFRLAILVAPLIAAWPQRAHAANGSWNVDAAGNWSLTTNWTPAAVPGTAAGDVVDLAFDITAPRTVTIDATSRTVGDLNIGDPTATLFGYTLASSGAAVVLNLDGTGTTDATIDFTSAIANTISAPLTLVDNAVFRSNVAAVQTLSGIISGAGKTVTYNNDTNGTVNAAAALAGQFFVTGANTYTGGTTISDVRVQIQTSNAALGPAGSPVNILDGGQVLNNTGLTAIANAFTIAGNGWAETTAGQPFGALRLDSGAIVTGTVAMSANASIGSFSGTGTVNGVVSGAGFTLTKRGPAIIALGGANTYSGGTVIDGASGSILQLNNNSAGGTGAITWAAGSLGRLRVNAGVAIANVINIPAGLAGVAGTGLLEQAGTGQATYNGAINILGAVPAGGHILGSNTVGNEIVLNGLITSAATVSQRDGRVIYKGGGTGYTGLLVTGTAMVGVNNGISTAANVTLGGSGTGTLDLNGFDQSLAGLTFGQAANANTGIVTLGAKTLTLTADVSTITGAFNAPHAINGAAGGALNVGAAGRTFTIADSTAADDLAINTAAITGAGGIIKAGPGTLALRGVTVAGPLTVTAGTLATGNAGVIGSATTGSLAFGPGATTLRMKVGPAGDAINTGALTAGGTTTVNLSQVGGILANGTYNLINYTGASPGLGGFSLAPVGHSASTLIDTGTAIALNVTGNDRVIWDGTASTAWATGATGNWKRQSTSAATDYIEADDVIFQDSPVNSTVVIAANVTPSKVSFTNSSATNYSVTGAGGITGITGLTKTGNGTVSLATPNTYTGATTISAGTLELDHDATGNVVLSATSGVSVAPGATLKLTRDDGGFTFNRDITGTGALEINAHSAAGGVVAQNVFLTGNNAGFTGTLRLAAPVTGTYRLQTPTPAQLGGGSIEVASGAQLYTAAQTYANNITIAGIGYTDANGNIGALRLEPGATWAGNVVVNGSARIGAHNGTGTISGAISGGNLEVDVTNYNNNYTVVFTGSNSYGNTTIGGGSIQTAGVPTMRLNIGNGGTSGTLGTGNVIIHGDGANGVLGFDRSDGYALLPGQTITASNGAGTIANSITRTFLDLDSLGTGFRDNGNTISFGAALPTSGGTIRIGQGRAGAIATFTGTSTSEKIAVSAALSGATLNINPGANITTNFFTIGEAANATGGVVNQTGGTVNVFGQFRAGHFGTETGTYNMNGGALTLTGPNSTLTPSTSGAGAASATGDNNINALATATIHGGGIYLGIDGTGVFNHNGGTVTTNWIVLDNRGDTPAGANMPDGIDRYTLSGAGSTLNLRSTWGLIQRNTSSAVSFGGGTVRVDNTGTGTGTGANITIPLDATIDTVASTTTNLDTNGALNGFTLTRDVRGTGTLNFMGGGTINASTTGNQNIAANITGSTSFTKLGAGTTNLTGTSSGYTGNVTVSAGRLNVANNLAAGTITVADSAALGGEPAVTNLNLGAVTGSTVFLNPNTAGALTAANLAVAGTNTLDFTAVPAAAGPWTAINYTAKTGAGTFTVANAANYRTAPSVIDNGSSVTVNVTNTKALTWTGTGAVTTVWDNNGNTNWVDTTPAADKFFAGDTVTFGDGPAVTGVTVTSGVSPWKTTVNSATNNYTLTSATLGIAGPGSLEKSGASTLTLVGPNTYSGRTVISGGTVSLAAATSLGNASATNSLALSGGGRLSYTGSTAVDLGINRAIAVGTGGGVLSHNNATAVAVSVPGSISGSGDLSFSSAAAGAGTFVLTGDNSGYTGNISVNAASTGITALRVGTASATPGGGSITLNYPAAGATGNATTLDLPGTSLAAGVTLNMTSFLNGAISLRSQVTSSGNASINGPITVAGTSIVQLSASSGTLTVNGNVTAGAGGFNSATSVLLIRGAGNGVVNGTINLPGGGVSKTDASTWTINSTGNVWALTGVLSSGSVRLGANNALPVGAILSIGQASDANNSLLEMNGFNQEVNGLTWIAGSGNSSRAVGNSSATLSTLTLNSSTDYTYGATTGITGGLITGNIALVKNGTNTQTLAGANTFTGSVTVNNGTLVAGGTQTTSLGSATTAGRTITVNSPGALSFTTNNIYGNGVGNANLPSTILNAGTTLTSNRYNTLGPVTLNGATLTQSATDSGGYEGFQFKGLITVGGSAASTISTGNGKANHLDANTIFNVADATGSSAVDLTVSAPLRNQSGDFGSATGGLTKAGPGTMLLSGISTYTGSTVINGGILSIGTGASIAAASAVTVNGPAVFNVNGTAGPVTVNSGGSLTGSGTVGNVSFSGGAIISPGNSPGILNTGSVTTSAGVTFNMELTGPTPGAGGYDQINTSGTVGLNGTLVTTLTYQPAVNDKLFIWLNDGADPITGTFTGLPEGSSIPTPGGGTFTISYTGNGDAGAIGNDVSLTYVPEPGSAAMLVAGAAMLGLRRRRLAA